MPINSLDPQVSLDLCVLVDAYRSGALLINAFKALGIERFAHVDTGASTWEPYRTVEHRDIFNWVEMCVKKPDESAIMRILQSERVLCIVAGTETGVEVADSLSEGVGVKTNGTRLSQARRDKALMVEALNAARIPCMESRRCDTLAEALSFRQEQAVVIKPLRSAGGECVTLCTTNRERELAFALIVDKENHLSELNRGILIQEYVDGEEFIIDSVSCEGSHAIAAVWKVGRVSRNGVPFLCETTCLLDVNSVPKRVLDYGMEVLDALNIRFGPAHMELKVRRQSGDPVLLEIAARLHGACFPRLTESSLEWPQHLLTALSYAAPKRFHQVTATPYLIKKHLCILELLSEHEGTVSASPQRRQAEAGLLKLESYYDSELPKPGVPLVRTVDVMSSPGWVALSHLSNQQIDADLKAIRLTQRALLDTEIG